MRVFQQILSQANLLNAKVPQEVGIQNEQQVKADNNDPIEMEAIIEKQHKVICQRYKTSHGINPIWIIHNSNTVHKNIATFNRHNECKNIRTYGFSTLYTSIPHAKLKNRITWVIKEGFLVLRNRLLVYTHAKRDGLINQEIKPFPWTAKK